jgi:putative flippase GtrA
MSWFVARLDALVALVARLGLPADFVRFGIVGCSGFFWNTGAVYALRGPLGAVLPGLWPLDVAEAVGFFVAASANWALNRWWTFSHVTRGAMHRQWLRFLGVNAVGFVFNCGVYFALVAAYATVRHQPVLGIMAGSVAGLTCNYFLSKTFVFR